MGVKALPAQERPRERLFRLGAGALTDRELLAVLVGSGVPGKDALALGEELARQGWAALSRRSATELTQWQGIGRARAAVLVAALEVGRRVRQEPAWERPIHSGADVEALLGDEMAALSQEQFRVILLNTKLSVLGVEVAFIGGLSSVEVHPREVFRRAVQAGAAGVVAVHNHPSGDPSPSREDRLLTDRLQEAGDVLGIPLWDHVVLGRGRYTSFREQGLLK